MQKEAKARIKINELLQNAGWRFLTAKTEKQTLFWKIIPKLQNKS